MSDVPDLITWLRVQLDAREREVRERHRRVCGHDDVGPDAPCNCDDHVSTELANVAADRALLEFCAQMLRQDAAPWDSPDDVDPTCWYVLRLRAAAYAHHPGYQEDWRP